MLTSYELAQMRRTQESAFPDTVTIKRRVLADDGFGGVTSQGEVIVGAGVAARITQAQLMAYGTGLGRDLDIEKWTVRLPHGTDLRDEDIIEWGGYRLRVETVKPRSFGTAMSATAERIKGAGEVSGESA